MTGGHLLSRPTCKSHTVLLVTVWLFFVWTGRTCAWTTENEPNDQSSQANGVVCGDTVRCATLEPSTDTDCFRFTAYLWDSIFIITLPCNGGNTNTLIVLYDDADSILAVDDNGGEWEYSRIRYLARYSGEYVVRVMRHPSSADSSYCLLVSCAIPQAGLYDTCGGARIVTELPYYDEGSTLGATHQCGTAADDVFYRFHAPMAGDYSFMVCTDDFDARVQVLGSCCADFLDDASEGCGLGAQLIVFGLPTDDYFILVEGTTAQQRGDFSIEIQASLPECPAPQRLTLGTVGGLPFLDWEELPGTAYYVIWSASASEGVYEHLGTAFLTYFTDSTGFVNARRFYRVTTVCQW